MPMLELSDEQVIELVKQLSPTSKRKVIEELSKNAFTGGGELPSAPVEVEDFISLPCFGMWADHEAMDDSVAWVRKERARWQKRTSRQG
jgi:hypothetical protein